MIGFLVFLIMFIKACMPPASPPAMPSHSSMIITARSMQLPPFAFNFSVWLPERELLIWSTIFLLLASEALYSMSLYFGLQRATRVQVVVLPIPGGPLTKAARALIFSGAGWNFLFGSGAGCSLTLPRRTTSSQSRSHSANFRTWSVFPMTSPRCFGRCLSAHGTLAVGAMTAKAAAAPPLRSPTRLAPSDAADKCFCYA
mmetsp:Transcript_39917/g.100276  ORF Transcript_39917/g.100276 Transcript_39917/m.100276 type:complete len:200 (-) Transcript_39917:12-611(-)